MLQAVTRLLISIGVLAVASTLAGAQSAAGRPRRSTQGRPRHRVQDPGERGHSRQFRPCQPLCSSKDPNIFMKKRFGSFDERTINGRNCRERPRSPGFYRR